MHKHKCAWGPEIKSVISAFHSNLVVDSHSKRLECSTTTWASYRPSITQLVANRFACDRSVTEKGLASSENELIPGRLWDGGCSQESFSMALGHLDYSGEIPAGKQMLLAVITKRVPP